MGFNFILFFIFFLFFRVLLEVKASSVGGIGKILFAVSSIFVQLTKLPCTCRDRGLEGAAEMGGRTEHRWTCEPVAHVSVISRICRHHFCGFHVTFTKVKQRLKTSSHLEAPQTNRTNPPYPSLSIQADGIAQ